MCISFMALCFTFQAQVDDEINKLRKKLADCGEAVRDKKSKVLNIFGEFTRDFGRMCDRGSSDKQATEL